MQTLELLIGQMLFVRLGFFFDITEALFHDGQTVKQCFFFGAFKRFFGMNGFIDGGQLGRYQRLQPTVNEIFDSSAIARVSLGATWRKLSPVERKQFVQLMVDTIAATYADRFVDYTGQQFEVLSELENRPGRWVVKTVLTKADGGKVNLDYYIKDGRIFNVIADGVSDLSLRRADYAGVIKQNGYVFLLESLKNKLAAFGK